MSIVAVMDTTNTYPIGYIIEDASQNKMRNIKVAKNYTADGNAINVVTHQLSRSAMNKRLAGRIEQLMIHEKSGTYYL